MKTKRMMTLLLALVMAVGLAVPATAAPITFKDVKTSDWFYSDVQKAVDTGLINGYPDNTYGPTKNMTYAEAIKLAAVMYKMATTGSNEFETGNPWYQPYVDYAKNTGVISKDYDWNKPATRAGYMEIFAKAIPDMPANSGMKGLTAMNTVPDGSIPDVPMSHPQAAAIYKLYRAGILQGNDAQHTCRPDSNIQRSEVAAILTRMMNAGERLSFSMGEEDALTITTQPADVSVAKGEDATFTVAVSGGKAPYTYQWRKIRPDGEDIIPSGGDYEGLTAATLTAKDNTMSFDNGAQYYCIVTDAAGAKVTSDKATLTVTEAADELEITTHPQSITISEGTDAVFTVAVSGGKAPYTYEWHLDGADSGYDTVLNNGTYVSGAGTPTLTSMGCTKYEDGDQYYCIITDADQNTVTSSRATLTVTEAASPLKITTHPLSVTISEGSNVVFTVAASGGQAPYTYEWHLDGAESGYDNVLNNGTYVAGADTPTLTSKDCGIHEDGDQYYCIVTDAAGNKVTSSRATLTVTPAPALAVDKMSRNQVVAEGSDVLLYVEVTGGKAPYTYQWQYCYPGETKFWNLEDAAEHGEKFKVENNGARSELTLLKFNTLITNQSGSKYRCLITDANHNTKTSDPITVTLAGPRS